MANLAVYWRNFDKESSRGDWPCTRWFSNRERLVSKLANGDRLWLFTSGDKAGRSEINSGYLVEVFVVDRVSENAEGASNYAPEEFGYVIHGDALRCEKVDPPLLIDEIIRPAGHEVSEPIGRLRQGPWRLTDADVTELERRRSH